MHVFLLHNKDVSAFDFQWYTACTKLREIATKFKMAAQDRHKAKPDLPRKSSVQELDPGRPARAREHFCSSGGFIFGAP
jgi:hypothetical protein